MPWKEISPPPRGRGLKMAFTVNKWVRSPGESIMCLDGDARRFVKGCKFRIVVSFRVLRTECNCFTSWMKAFDDNVLIVIRVTTALMAYFSVCLLRLEWYLVGFKQSFRHTHIGLLWGFNPSFRRASPFHLTWESFLVNSLCSICHTKQLCLLLRHGSEKWPNPTFCFCSVEPASSPHFNSN